MKKFIAILFDIITWLFLGIIALIALFTIGSNTNLLGGYKSYMVLSGSMEPTILIGDIIISHHQNEYVKNDVITFVGEDQRIVTHRIILVTQNNNEIKYTTKGDANRSEDDAFILQESVIGKVIFVIPKLGYFINFARSLPGLIILVVVPVIALILDQVLKLRQ